MVQENVYNMEETNFLYSVPPNKTLSATNKNWGSKIIFFWYCLDIYNENFIYFDITLVEKYAKKKYSQNRLQSFWPA